MKFPFKNLSISLILSMIGYSCTPDNSAAEATVKIDSIVNAELELLHASAKRKNDSIIQLMSVNRADSMMADTTLLFIK